MKIPPVNKTQILSFKKSPFEYTVLIYLLDKEAIKGDKMIFTLPYRSSCARKRYLNRLAKIVSRAELLIMSPR